MPSKPKLLFFLDQASLVWFMFEQMLVESLKKSWAASKLLQEIFVLMQFM
jgi:hypothetical protein